MTEFTSPYCIIKQIYHIQSSYTNVSKGHTRTCTGVRKSLKFKKKKQETVLSDASYECFVGAKRLLSLSICAFVPPHCTILLLTSRAVNLLVFEMEATSR